MSVSTASHRVEFQDRAKKALQDASLQRALAKARGGFVDHRQDAIDALPGVHNAIRSFTPLQQCQFGVKAIPSVCPKANLFGLISRSVNSRSISKPL